MTNHNQDTRFPPESPLPDRCPTPTILAGHYAADGALARTGELIAVPCRRWSCPKCSRRKVALWRRLITDALAHHRIVRLVTITFPLSAPADFHERSHTRYVSTVLSRWADRVRRYHSPRLEYVAVKESTRRGRLHVHLLTTGPFLRLCPSRCTCSTTGPDYCPRHAACQITDSYHAPDCFWHGATGAVPTPGGPTCAPNCHDPATCARACHRPGGCITDHRRHCPQAIAHDLGAGWIDVRRPRGAAASAVGYLTKYLAKHMTAAWPRYARRASYSRHFACTHPDTPTRRRLCDLTASIDGDPDRRPSIGRLDAAWRRQARTRALDAGLIRPTDPDIVWRYVHPTLAPFDPATWQPPPPPAPIDLDEVTLIRRHAASLPDKPAWLVQAEAQASRLRHRINAS